MIPPLTGVLQVARPERPVPVPEDLQELGEHFEHAAHEVAAAVAAGQASHQVKAKAAEWSLLRDELRRREAHLLGAAPSPRHRRVVAA